MTNPALSHIVDGRFGASQNPAKNQQRGASILRKTFSLLIGFALIASAKPASATVKPEPSGIYDLLFGAPGTGKIDLTNNPLLDNPNIDGYRYKVGWAKIQPDNAATFNWASIDSAISIAAAHGKKLCISIAGGLSTPGWAYTTAPIIYKYTYLE
ncbi:MAG: hypothetical protein ABIR29_03030, partial [Chthoniobacterales bacterium]